MKEAWIYRHQIKVWLSKYVDKNLFKIKLPVYLSNSIDPLLFGIPLDCVCSRHNDICYTFWDVIQGSNVQKKIPYNWDIELSLLFYPWLAWRCNIRSKMTLNDTIIFCSNRLLWTSLKWTALEMNTLWFLPLFRNLFFHWIWSLNFKLLSDRDGDLMRFLKSNSRSRS